MTLAPRSRARAVVLGVAVTAAAWCGLASTDAADPPVDEAPRDTDLIERTAAELAQFDVTMRGDRDVVGTLVPEDFKIRLGLRQLREFRLDRLCPGKDHAAGDAPPAAARVPAPAPSYLLYFDQPHLTQPGRQRAIDLARELVPLLAAGGGRVTVVSNAWSVDTYVEDSDEPDRILDAIDELESDRRQWDPYASFESARVEEVLRDLNQNLSAEIAIFTARRHQRYERWVTEKSLRRLDQVIGRFAAVDPPKAVLYFADTMRANAGAHYLSFFGRRTIETKVTLSVIRTEAETARLAFDSVVAKASALGVRFYTVHAQGLVLDDNISRMSASAMERTDQLLDGSVIRIRDAQSSMSSLAQETGGAVFLHAPRGRKIAARILEDLACVYVVSFDPGRLDRDQPIPLRVRVLRDGVEAFARGQLVVQSEEARRESRLLAAFSAPGNGSGLFDVRESLIPVDFVDGRFRALLQVHVPAVPFTRATWDIGATVVPERSRRTSETSGRITIPAPGAPAVLEAEIEVEPGALQLVAVAHETETDEIASGTQDVFWPDPDEKPATAGPLALMQPRAGVFVRDGAVRAWGSLGLGPDHPVEAGLPTAVVALACRAPRMERAIVVERALTGPVTLAFEPAEIRAGDHRCVQIRDVIPAGRLQAGRYVYRMRVRIAGREYDAAERAFVVVDDTARPMQHGREAEDGAATSLRDDATASKVGRGT